VGHQWLQLTQEDLSTELAQARQEGRDLSGLLDEFERLSGSDMSLSSNREEAGRLLDAAQSAPIRVDYEYDEPDELQAILKEKSDIDGVVSADLEGRIDSAWRGRCAGCLLGKPVEGWKREKIRAFLSETGQWPLREYMTAECSRDTLLKYEIHPGSAFIGRVKCMPEDDDINYTIVGLSILERYGPSFMSTHVMQAWASSLPILHTCTAERVAYRNFVNGLTPPLTAKYRNPYREWIGAQIRADIWGYVYPGNPLAAAELAWKDARVSHVKNGIYGEMWAAGMVSAAFVAKDIDEVLDAGLRCIPTSSRLYEAINGIRFCHKRGEEANAAIAGVHQRWNEASAHDWCHTISNAEVVAASLLWGGGAFQDSVCMAVSAGFDTDCNGATVGSILGAFGARIGDEWTDPLANSIESGVAGFERANIGELAARTAAVSKTARQSRAAASSAKE
jgi:ADP-ribosylglycohydrolase